LPYVIYLSIYTYITSELYKCKKIINLKNLSTIIN
jgi:hypothetical protein